MVKYLKQFRFSTLVSDSVCASQQFQGKFRGDDRIEHWVGE